MNRDEIIRKTNLILQLCMNINNMASDKRPTIFFEFSGHVDLVDVRVIKDGWKRNEKNNKEEFRVFIDTEDAEKELNEIIVYLKELKEKLEEEDE